MGTIVSWKGLTHVIGVLALRQSILLHATGENNWWCPPLYLIPRLIRHGEVTRAQGTLVIPQWPSAPFWPILFPSESRPAESVQQIVELPRKADLSLPGQSGSSVFKSTPNVAVLALRLKFGL